MDKLEIKYWLSKLISYLASNFRLILLQIGLLSIGVATTFSSLFFYFWINGANLGWVANLKGIGGIFLLFIFFIELSFIIMNFSASIYWLCAKNRGGMASYLRTSLSLIKETVISIIIFNVFFILLSIGMSIDSPLIGFFSVLGIIGSIIFGIVRMSIQTAKINNFHPDRGTNVFLFGTLIQCPFYYLIFKFIINYLHPLTVFMISFSSQAITMFIVIFLGAKIMNKFFGPTIQLNPNLFEKKPFSDKVAEK